MRTTASLRSLVRWLVGAGRSLAFMVRVMPMLPSGWLDRYSAGPRYEQITLPGGDERTSAEFFRPGSAAPHAGVVVCLGVIPFDVTHPQVRRLGSALARRGFAALIVWSPEMRSLRVSAHDTQLLVSAYQWLIDRPDIDADRCGFLGTCVGGGFALMSAAQPEIRDQVRFVTCFAPFGSLRTLALDIGSGTTEIDGLRRPWPVDQLSRRVYVRTLTAHLDPAEAMRLETAWFERQPLPQPDGLSAAARALLPILLTSDRVELARRLDQLPELRQTVDAVDPVGVAGDVRAAVVTIGHDRDDLVVPFGESQRLFAALPRGAEVSLTEFHLFQHADPTKRKMAKVTLVRELWKFVRFCGPALRYGDRAF